ncbi:uncharacterized protein RJT21DRAFT_119588 [Scheffersomyces amazonensis]|uniref:uncharacterized protein n=1 Tax=Scheffersomyces amazonensis TaxID=1078765 RepID=UPI00315DD692
MILDAPIIPAAITSTIYCVSPPLIWRLFMKYFLTFFLCVFIFFSLNMSVGLCVIGLNSFACSLGFESEIMPM